ncbi:unnamed protein product [Chilo suppressalis]|uniref:Uncharacterized protein n=1 Tax=Chilo suppressalis TaxID=168631 RepID=A0ABN8B938_CHISP|nr:unnamed protein product [Chilo suppressalis]
MLVDEMPRSFVKKNNSYSHYPLKKRPVHVLYEESSESVKDVIIDVVTDDIPEPENLSTKPEDLSRISEKYRSTKSISRSPSPTTISQQSSSPVRLIPVQPTLHQHLYPSKPITPPGTLSIISTLVARTCISVITTSTSTSFDLFNDSATNRQIFLGQLKSRALYLISNVFTRIWTSQVTTSSHPRRFIITRK